MTKQKKPEDADARESRFVARGCAAGPDRAWLRDQRRAPRRLSTLRPDLDAPAWWRDDLSSPDRQTSSESATRHHIAAMAQPSELAMNAIAARSGLTTKRQRSAGTTKTLAQLPDRTRIIGNLSQIFQRPGAAALSHCDRDPFFVNIQANKSSMFHEARFLCMRLCAGHPV